MRRIHILPTLAWLCAALAPWWALRLQENIRYGETPELLRTWGTLFTFAHTVAVILVLASLRNEAPSAISSPAPWLRIRRLVAACAFATVALYIADAATKYSRVFWFTPIDPTRSDQISLIQLALRDLVRDGVNPYHLHKVGSLDISLNYWPGLWLPFAPAHWARVDLRVASMAGACATSLLVAAWGAWRLAESRDWTEAIPAMLPLAFPLLLFGLFRDFMDFSHVGVHWLLLGMWALCLLNRRPVAAAACLAVCAVGRQYCVLLLPLWGIYLWPRLRTDPRPVKRAFAAFLLTALCVGLPFLALGPHEFIVNAFGSFETQLARILRENPLAAHGMGYSGVLLDLRAYGVRLPIALLFAAAIYAHAGLAGLGTERSLVIHAAAVIFSFLYFAGVPFFYTYIDPLMLLAIAAPAAVASKEWSPRARRWIAATACALPIVLFAVFAARTRTHSPKGLPTRTGDGSTRLKQSKKLLSGYDLTGWVENEGRNPHAMLLADSYFALPGIDIEAKRLTLAILRDPAAGAADAEVFLNGEPLGTITIPTGESTMELRIPEENLFRGGNLVRIHLVGSAAKEKVPQGALMLLRATLE